MLKTRLMNLFGLDYPIVLAPMGLGYTSGQLAAAVTKAGGLGLFGGTHEGGPDWVREQIRFIRSRTDRPFGVGFISFLIPRFMDNFSVCLEERVPVLAFSFGDPTDYVPEAANRGALVLCQVQSGEQGRTAVQAGADVIVAQGTEGGGHIGHVGNLPCLSSVLETADGRVVIASGGIADGRSLAGVMAAGAEGAWMGTAFLASEEAVEIPDAYKDRIVASDGTDTVPTLLYDTVLRVRFPQGIAARVAVNRFTTEWANRDAELRDRLHEVLPIAAPTLDRHDPEVQPTWMGQSAGAIRAVRPVQVVMREICEDAERLLRQHVPSLLSDT